MPGLFRGLPQFVLRPVDMSLPLTSYPQIHSLQLLSSLLLRLSLRLDSAKHASLFSEAVLSWCAETDLQVADAMLCLKARWESKLHFPLAFAFERKGSEWVFQVFCADVSSF